MSARHWADIGEVTSVGGIKLLFLVFRLFGRWPVRLILYPVVLFYLVRDPLARSYSRDYLLRLYRWAKRDERDIGAWLTLRHFTSFAESILDKLRVWDSKVEIKGVVYHDQQFMNEEIAAGRGGLIIISHLGNAEMCRRLSMWHAGVKMTALVHTMHARALNNLIAELNPNSMLNVLQVTEITPETAVRLGERVAQGEFVVIAGDRVPVSAKPRVTMADFFGAPAPFPVGPYVLAHLMQCPTYLLVCLRLGSEYHVYYERFRDRITLRRADREAMFASLAADYSARLMHYCQIAPLQWFNFYDFWAMPTMAGTDAAA